MRTNPYKHLIICILCSIIFLISFTCRAQVIDFEPQAGFDPVEGESINNAFMEATYGISFHMDDLNGIPPIMVRTGSPQLGFFSSSSSQNCGSGTTTHDIIYDGGSDCYFISDLRVNNAPDSLTFFMDYIDNCCSGASGELLDIDAGEVWLIRVYTPGNNSAVASYTLCEGGTCDFNSTGDGDGSLWIVDISPDPIDYISFTLVDQDGGPGAGMGIDNIDYCISSSPPEIVSEQLNLCEIDTIPVWQGIPIQFPGFYTDEVEGLNGCDTTYELSAFADGTVYSQNINTSCNIQDTITDFEIYMTAEGCDSIHTVITIPEPPDTSYTPIFTCDIALAGQDTSFLMEAIPCDIFIIGFYVIIPSDTTIITEPTCSIDDSEPEIESLQNQNGCDSIIITFHPVVNDTSYSYSTESTCNSLDTIIEAVAYTGVDGCDSIHYTTYLPAPLDTLFDTVFTCNIELANSDTIIHIDSMPCDYALKQFFLYTPPDTSNVITNICNIDSVGVDTVLIIGQNGCDSLLVFQTYSYTGPLIGTNTNYSCVLDSITIDSSYYLNPNGCDSVHITTTYPAQADTIFSLIETCDVDLQGVDSLILIPGTPCDTVLNYEYVLSQSDTTISFVETCDSNMLDTTVYVLQGNDGCDSIAMEITELFKDTIHSFSVLDSCGLTDTLTIKNSYISTFGCDSIHTSYFIPISQDSVYLQMITCDPDMADTDSIWTGSSVPCDVIYIASFIYNDPDTTIIEIPLCEPELPDTSAFIYPNINGCDSIVLFTEVINGHDITTLDSSFSCDLNSIQLDTTHHVTSAGCDSNHITVTIPAYSDTSIVREIVCEESEAGFDTVYYNNSFGCDSLVIYESIYENISLTLSPDTTVVAGQPVLLVAQSNVLPTNISWNPPGPDSMEWLIFPSEDVFYSIHIIDSTGCTAEATAYIQLEELGKIYIPNAFSPNGDGINDYWQVYPTEGIEILKIEIFERWGNKVWESGLETKWDGRMNGKRLESNAFSALVIYRDTLTNESYTAISEIHLIR